MSRTLRHYILFTAGFSIFWFLFKLGGMIDPWATLRSTAVDMALNTGALVLTVEWLLPHFFYKRHYIRFSLGLGVIIFVGGSANILLQLWLMHSTILQYQANLARYKEHFYFWFWSDLVAGSYFMIGFIALGGTAIKLAFDRIVTSRRMTELEAATLRSELDHLRSQLNPHFLFNALNTIYYRIDKKNIAARVLTQQFSALLRYQLYECNDPEVRIENELRFIENYIDLQRQRAGDGLVVTAEGFQCLQGFTIPSHLLVTLVENCFKHVSHFPDRENYIQLSAQRENGHFLFCAINSYEPGAAAGKPGIGLTATRRRLELFCDDRYCLTTKATDVLFEATLKLPIV